MNRVKRVKFIDTEVDHILSSSPDASSIRYATAQVPRSDAPKTSEYAFFSKLRKSAGGSHSHPLGNEDNQLKSGKPSDCNGAISNKFKHSSKDLRSSFLAEKARPTNEDSFLACLNGESKKATDIADKVKRSFKDFSSPLLTENVTPINHNLFPSAHGGALKNAGNWSEKGVFFAKRQKLRQGVSDTSLPEVDELCSKGLDLVSVLLSRLLPEGNENNYCRNPKSKQEDSDTTNQIDNLYESDNLILVRHSQRECPHRIGWVDSDSPSASYGKIHFPYEERNYDRDLDGRRTSTLCKNRDSSFCLSFGNYGSHELSHPKVMNEFRELNGAALERDPHTLFLGWDFEKEKNERELSLAYHNREINLYSTLLASWDDDHQENLFDRLDASPPCSASLFSKYPMNFSSLPHLYSVRFPRQEFRSQHEDQKHVFVEMDQFPLTISCNPPYPKLVEDCNANNIFESKSIILSPQNHSLFPSNFYSEKYYPGLEAILLPSGMDIDFRWRCLSMTESPTNHHSSTYGASFPQRAGISMNSQLLAEEKKESSLHSLNPSKTTTHFLE
ncbi:unnamed protein product, partial [Ilex paraguariensis]